MADQPTYRARLRFRVQKKLNIQTHDYPLQIAGREAVLSSPLTEVNICDSEWLVINTRGFANEADAATFAHNLRAALELSSVSTRLGVDAGTDLPTAGLGAGFRAQIRDKTGQDVRSNVHGVDVFVDDPNVRILNIDARGTVLAGPEPFLGDLDGLHASAANASTETKDMILLSNAALMQPNPVAQIVFAFSAVEMLGQQRTWSPEQENLLRELASAAEASPLGNADERREVSDAIRHCYRVTLRQGVLRLLDDLGLSDLKKSWDEIYGERSKLVHGLAPRPGIDYSDLAFRAVSLCGRILLKAVAVDIPVADRHVDRFYERK